MSSCTAWWDWFPVFVVRKGISVNVREKDIEGDYTNIDPISISSVTCDLFSTIISNSPIYITKKAQKRKVEDEEDEVAPIITAHEKRPRTVAALDISWLGILYTLFL